ncbi:MAG: hypothetical protein AB7M05_14485 [Alphaproteobacteria bacterium]
MDRDSGRLRRGTDGRSTAAHAEDEATKDVRAAAEQFYIALDALFKGNVAPMAEMWSHKDDVT